MAVTAPWKGVADSLKLGPRVCRKQRGEGRNPGKPGSGRPSPTGPFHASLNRAAGPFSVGGSRTSAQKRPKCLFLQCSAVGRAFLEPGRSVSRFCETSKCTASAPDLDLGLLPLCVAQACLESLHKKGSFASKLSMVAELLSLQLVYAPASSEGVA